MRADACVMVTNSCWSMQWHEFFCHFFKFLKTKLSKKCSLTMQKWAGNQQLSSMHVAQSTICTIKLTRVLMSVSHMLCILGKVDWGFLIDAGFKLVFSRIHCKTMQFENEISSFLFNFTLSLLRAMFVNKQMVRKKKNKSNDGEQNKMSYPFSFPILPRWLSEETNKMKINQFKLGKNGI